jgi:hypothetical protein
MKANLRKVVVNWEVTASLEETHDELTGLADDKARCCWCLLRSQDGQKLAD